MNRYVIKNYASDWKDIGIELKLQLSEIDYIAERRRKAWPDYEDYFRDTLDYWLRYKSDATWKTLEVALTNVSRLKLKLNPVDDVYAVHTDDISATSSKDNGIFVCSIRVFEYHVVKICT